MELYILKEKNGKYKIPRLIRFLAGKRNFKFEYKNKLYDKELNGNKEIKQVSLLVEALNIKDKR